MFNLNWISGDTITVDPVVVQTNTIIDFNMSPNPVVQNLQIQSQNPIDNISIIDLNGKTILSQNENNIYSKELYLNQLPSGVYLIKVTSDDNYSVRALVKQ